MPELEHNPLLESLIRKAQEDDEFQKVARDYHAFHALGETPAWVRLNMHLETILDGYQKQLVQVLMSGAPVDQREIDRVRGFIQGVRSVLSLPGRIDASFEQAVNRAWNRAVESFDGDPEQEE